ncbi:MAG TPA: serine protease [Kofleriaceae bacterium]|nr:serine protease [Kofleriaceae bacterium]
MIDPQLFQKLDQASFSAREQLAEEIARRATPAQLVALSRALEHPSQRVRLGVIEVLRRATHRASTPLLFRHAQAHDGDERVFAIRALVHLAQPGDDWLAPAARGWLVSGDPFVEAHAAQLARVLALAPPAADVGERGEPAGDARLELLVSTLLTARTHAERDAAVGELERRGPAPLAAAARVILPKGGADVVALVCRALIRQRAALPGTDRLIPRLEAAGVRLRASPIACAAIDDALLAIGGVAGAPSLLTRLAELDPGPLAAVIADLRAIPAPELALHASPVLDALERDRARWPALGPVLVHAAPHLRGTERDRLRRLADVLVADLRGGQASAPGALATLARVLAQVGERGAPLPRPLRVALERLATAEAAHALCALCARLGTEEAAGVLVAMLGDPLLDARRAAREALEAWQSPWVRVELAGEPAIVATYQDGQGQPLVRQGNRLVAPAGGEEHVLDARGVPVRAGDTEHGGCLCCGPPRALVRRRREGLRCPSSGESHLRDGGRVMFERDHPLGRCRVCDSTRPRVRDGARIVCMECGVGSSFDAGPAPDEPALPSERGGRRGDDDALPRPPTADELELIAPHIRAAITANVFLVARDGAARWSGSGIVIARDGSHVAILTNRHVVESDDSRRPAALRALTVAGEEVIATTVWRAGRGIDLAIVEARVAQPDRLAVMPLGTGTVLVGAPVFAIGNPLGLAWSYTAGTLSAIRHWTTHEGQSVRILQTDAPLAPGSSGGGLFHTDGHLLGVMSFLRQGHAGGSAHFALSIEAIRAALVREDVRWRGTPLAQLA